MSDALAIVRSALASSRPSTRLEVEATAWRALARACPKLDARALTDETFSALRRLTGDPRQ